MRSDQLWFMRAFEIMFLVGMPRIAGTFAGFEGTDVGQRIIIFDFPSGPVKSRGCLRRIGVELFPFVKKITVVTVPVLGSCRQRAEIWCERFLSSFIQ